MLLLEVAIKIFEKKFLGVQLKTSIDVVVHCIVQGCDFSDHKLFAALLSNLKRLVMTTEIVFIAKANARPDLAEGLLINNHPDRLHFRLYLSRPSHIAILLTCSFSSFDFQHIRSVASVEPLSPKKIGLLRFLLQVPPPSFLQQFLH